MTNRNLMYPAWAHDVSDMWEEVYENYKDNAEAQNKQPKSFDEWRKEQSTTI